MVAGMLENPIFLYCSLLKKSEPASTTAWARRELSLCLTIEVYYAVPLQL
jgi:hypothetical protein